MGGPFARSSGAQQPPADAPLVAVTATSYLADGRALEFSRIAWLADRVRFHATTYAGDPDRAATPS
jgi:DNA-binding GntR family transcriptional regulator